MGVLQIIIGIELLVEFKNYLLLDTLMSPYIISLKLKQFNVPLEFTSSSWRLWGLNPGQEQEEAGIAL